MIHVFYVNYELRLEYFEVLAIHFFIQESNKKNAVFSSKYKHSNHEDFHFIFSSPFLLAAFILIETEKEIVLLLSLYNQCFSYKETKVKSNFTKWECLNMY